MKRRLTLAAAVLMLISCQGRVHQDTFVISGTYLSVRSPHPEAARIIHEEFKRLDRIFNKYRADSQLARLNQTHGVALKVSPELIGILELSQQVRGLTDGNFDVTNGALYHFWKGLIAQESIEALPSQETITLLLERSGVDGIEIDKENSTVTIKRDGLTIDLSGIAKGYMVDKAVQKLKAAGIKSALINAGGDIYCLGTHRQRPWKVGIRKPDLIEGVIDTVPVVDGAIATSGNYEQFFEYNAKRYSHIIDPTTGYPVDNTIISVTVVAANCTSADALATAFFVMGLEKINRFIWEKGSNLKVFVVTEDERGRHLHIF